MQWKRGFLGILAAVPAVGLLAFGMTRDPRSIPSPLPGREAPTFALPVFTTERGTPAADTVRFAGADGRITIVNFWASWCLACRDEHLPLKQVGEEHREGDVRFVGVLYNDSPENGRRWIARMGGESYPSVTDAGARTAIDFGVYGVPETYFIGRDGRVAYKHTGPVTEELLRRKIAELRAAGAAVATPGGAQ